MPATDEIQRRPKYGDKMPQRAPLARNTDEEFVLGTEATEGIKMQDELASPGEHCSKQTDYASQNDCGSSH